MLGCGWHNLRRMLLGMASFKLLRTVDAPLTAMMLGTDAGCHTTRLMLLAAAACRCNINNCGDSPNISLSFHRETRCGWHNFRRCYGFLQLLQLTVAYDCRCAAACRRCALTLVATATSMMMLAAAAARRRARCEWLPPLTAARPSEN